MNSIFGFYDSGADGTVSSDGGTGIGTAEHGSRMEQDEVIQSAGPSNSTVQVPGPAGYHGGSNGQAAANGPLSPNTMFNSFFGITDGPQLPANYTATGLNLPIVGANRANPAQVETNSMTNAHQMRHNPNSIHELQQYRASLINIPREAGSLPTAGLGFIAMAAPLACPVKPSLQPQKPYKLSYNISTFMRRNVETLPDQASSASIRSALEGIEGGSLIALLYVLDRAPTGSDVWPDNRDQAKVPVKLTPIYCTSKRTYGIDVTTAEGRPVGSCHGRRTDHTNKSLPKERTPNLYGKPQVQGPTWPQKDPATILPMEIYHMILEHLSRDDVKALRLTCKEIEFRISNILLQTVVVPFNTEIYGMLHDVKGKGKLSELSTLPSPGRLAWKNSGNLNVYNGHGVDVFRGFGHHIKRYGMSFEVDEDILSSLPVKGMLHRVHTYWGEYEWPYSEYRRFKAVANLENTADEGSVMKIAFSHLQKVEELALSIDNGMGWIHGPDTSLYSRIMKEPPLVFGNRYDVLQLERRVQAQQSLWRMLKKICWRHPSGAEALAVAAIKHTLVPISRDSFDYLAGNNIAFGVSDMEVPRLDLRSLLDPSMTDLEYQHLVGTLLSRTPSPNSGALEGEDCMAGILFLTSDQIDYDRLSLKPNQLSKAQKEWLLETQWAQEAFILSYTLAVIDNPVSFANVHTLNLSRFPSGYLRLLDRDDFWDGLPQLSNLTILAIPEWNEVSKDEAGFVQVEQVKASFSTRRLETLLGQAIACKESLKALNIGWATGGEHETGIFGRNQHIMPAPVLACDWMAPPLTDDSFLGKLLWFPYVEHMTFTNCWMVPSTLCLFVQIHANEGSLANLTLESVSLTAQFTPLPKSLEAGAAYWIAGSIDFPPLHPDVVSRIEAQVDAGQFRWQQSDLFTRWDRNTTQLVPQPGDNWPNPLNVDNLDPDAEVVPSSVLPGTGIEIQDSWKGPHIVGSWPWVLDKISPGPLLGHFRSARTYKTVHTPQSYLQTLELRSCGYAKIPFRSHLQVAIDNPLCLRSVGNGIRNKSVLGQQMMSHKFVDDLAGYMTQYLPQSEAYALLIVWGCKMGWEDEDAAEVVTYDGHFKGGTSRFSTILSSDMIYPASIGDDGSVATHLPATTAANATTVPSAGLSNPLDPARSFEFNVDHESDASGDDDSLYGPI